MERRVLVEENHQLSDSTPISKASGSIIRIDAISIELAGAMEKNCEASNCEHFSIRGYAAEMRKKDMNICLPFAFDGNSQNKLEAQTDMLPPLHVAKFRWWRCQNCLREIGASSVAEEIGIVCDCFQRGVISSSTCPRVQSPVDTVMAAPEMDNVAGRKTDGYSPANVNEDEICLSSRGCNKEHKHEVGHAALVGHENSAGNDVNQKICNPTRHVAESNPCFIRERRADGPDALVVKSSSLVDSFAPKYGIYSAGDVNGGIKNLECVASTSATIHQRGTLTSADGEQRIASIARETAKLVGINNLEENDKLSSVNNEILAENCHQDQHIHSPGSLIRQKARKVRLLTELLGSKGNSENVGIRAEGGPSSVIPNTSAGLDTISVLRDQMAVQGSLRKHCESLKGKRKMSQDKERKPLELVSPRKLTKKARSIVLADCESEKDPSARVDLQSGGRSELARFGIDRNPMPYKGKNKQTQLEAGYSLSIPQRGVMPKTNHVKTGDAERFCADADGSFSKSAHHAFTNSRIKPFLRSSPSPRQAERKSSVFKKKNKQVAGGQACLVHKRTIVLGEGSVMRKGLDMMETEPETVKLQPAHDEIAGKGLDLSLNSYAVAHRNEKIGISKTGDGSDLLFPQQKGTTPREDPHLMKDVMHVGESSVSHKSASDRYFRKGLLCDLNENIAANRPSTLHEMQNLVPRVENGSFSRRQQLLDFSGTHSTENTVEVQEQGNDDIPMDIVELLARNQYERFCHEPERNFFFSKQTNDKRDAELMCFPGVHGNGMLKPFKEEKCRVTNPGSGKGIITTGDNVGFIQNTSTNCFSEIRGKHFNMDQLEGNSAFAGFSPFSKYKEKPSSGVQTSDSGSIRTGYPQNFKWKGDKVVSRFSPSEIPVSGVHNLYLNGSRQNEEAGHVSSSPIPNHMPFGFNISQKHATHSSSFEMRSQFHKMPRDGRQMIGDLNFNSMKLNPYELEMQKRNSDSEFFRRESSEYPFVSKHRGFDLNEKVPGSLDLHSNETIPAMQLLSLMDAGVQSSSAFSLDRNPKIFTKPFFPCQNHPKVSLDGTSSVLEKPLFLYDHHSKRGTGANNDSSRNPASAYYGKNHPSEKSCECPPAVPAVGAFVSPFQNEGNFKRGPGSTVRVSSKSAVRGRAVVQSRGRKSQKASSRESNPIQNKLKGFVGASDSKCIDFEAGCITGIAFPMRSIPANEICTLNRNPADFTIPEAGNVYMISGKDLKFGKKISSKGRSGLNNMDGRKRQRVTKLK